MRSAVVSGATGLVGSATAKKLASLGVEVLALGRQKISKSDVRSQFGTTASYLSIEMKEIRKLPQRLKEETNFRVRDCVFFHFAWSGARNLTDGGLPTQLLNAVYTATLVEVAKEMGCEKIVTAGTIQESLLERFINGESSEFSSPSQQDYALAKLAARDFSKINAYLGKIDLIHTRLSLPLDFSLKRGNYVARTLRQILQGQIHTPPVSDEVVDVVSIDDISRAYSLIGDSEVRMGDFYIGSSKPMPLKSLFLQFEDIVSGKGSEFQTDDSLSSVFDTTPIRDVFGFSVAGEFEEILERWDRR